MIDTSDLASCEPSRRVPQVRVYHQPWHRPTGLEVRRALRAFERGDLARLSPRLAEAHGRLGIFYVAIDDRDDLDHKWFPFEHERCLAHQRRGLLRLHAPGRQERLHGRRWWFVRLHEDRLRQRERRQARRPAADRKPSLTAR